MFVAVFGGSVTWTPHIEELAMCVCQKIPHISLVHVFIIPMYLNNTGLLPLWWQRVDA